MAWEELEKAGIKAYYKDDAVFIINDDCRQVLPLIPSGYIDLCLTDPPYGIALDLAWLSELHLAHSKPANRLDMPIVGDTGMDLNWVFNYPKWVTWGFPYISSVKATGWLVWDKQPGLMNTDRTMTTPVEMAMTNCWKGFRLVRAIWAGYMRDNGEQRFAHPTQKPQKVIDYCINKASELNDLVLDPFLGSGTTLVCAKKLGRRAIGVEIEERYCAIAVERLRQSVMDLRI